jgi:hypothetical protein
MASVVGFLTNSSVQTTVELHCLSILGDAVCSHTTLSDTLGNAVASTAIKPTAGGKILTEVKAESTVLFVS